MTRLYYPTHLDHQQAAARRRRGGGGAAAAAQERTAAATAIEAARVSLSLVSAQRTAECHISLQPPCSTSSISENKVMNSFEPGNVFKQCSNAKLAGKGVEVFSYSGHPTQFTASPDTVPRIGQMFREGENDMQKTFHGARIMKGGKQVNECITSSFDPATMFCITCKNRHCIVSKDSPSVVAFSDQNFVPIVEGDNSGTCMAVVRLEDAKLSDLSALILEMFDKQPLHPGSAILSES
jgi:hypothetical protein